jgi:hypothetical protein
MIFILKLDSIMSDNLINEITLDCLMNKEQYQKYISRKNTKKENVKDIKFYRKRIYYLTKELLLSKEQASPLLPEVKNAFDNYIKTCINYFKIIDRNDIIQEDFKDILDGEIDVINEMDEINEIEEIEEINKNIIINTPKSPDNFFMRQVKIKNSLDDFVKVKKNNPKEIILPKQKKINLKDPSLKNKGIVKKKNITNKYEDIQDNKNNEIKNIEIENDKSKNNESKNNETNKTDN